MCPACGNKEAEKLFKLDDRVEGGIYTVMQCRECGIAWTDPIPTAKEIHNHYPAEYHGKEGKQRFTPLLELLVRYSRKKRATEVAGWNGGAAGKILDIGCGRGWMLSFLREMGWEVHGTELSGDTSKFAREKLKLHVYTKSLTDCRFPDDDFDVVTIWHVLEHLPDPVSAIAEINRVLRPGGALIVEVPNFGGLQARLFKNKWFHLDSPRHLFHFNSLTLRKFLEDAGFRIVASRNLSWEYDLFGFVQSTLNFLCIRFDYLYNFIRSREGRMLKGNPLAYTWDFIITLLLTLPLLLLSLPVSVISSVMNMGGTLKFYCVKIK